MGFLYAILLFFFQPPPHTVKDKHTTTPHPNPGGCGKQNLLDDSDEWGQCEVGIHPKRGVNVAHGLKNPNAAMIFKLFLTKYI